MAKAHTTQASGIDTGAGLGGLRRFFRGEPQTTTQTFFCRSSRGRRDGQVTYGRSDTAEDVALRVIADHAQGDDLSGRGWRSSGKSWERLRASPY